MEKRLKIGTRPSPLALKQVEEIKNRLPSVDFDVIVIETQGDRDKNTPLSEVEGTDFFTDAIQAALLRGEIDIAVHSAKDLPDEPAKGLRIAAITGSIDPFDALVSKSGLRLHELKPLSRIGASSLRRKSQLNKYRNDLQIVDIRGNIEERLRILDESDLDAVVLAAAGLIRLGLENRIAQRIPPDIMKPHPLQGALAIEVREGDEKTAALFNKLDTRNNEKYS